MNKPNHKISTFFASFFASFLFLSFLSVSIAQAGSSYKEVLNYLSGQPVFSSKSVTHAPGGFWSTIKNDSTNVALPINGRTYWTIVHKCQGNGYSLIYNISPVSGQYDQNVKKYTRDTTIFSIMSTQVCPTGYQTLQSHGNHDIAYNGAHLYPYVTTTGSN
ncbi:MAG TPA: hypothetical protein PK299_11475 [Anaerolineales bacterium]|nr:hypothetical protein [Anaerolineales bacterium]